MKEAKDINAGGNEGLTPLRRAATLSDRTTELLRQRILAGDFGLGERLVEARIARLETGHQGR